MKLSSICIGLVGAVVLAGCGSSDPQGTLATVNGVPISEKDYFNYLQRKANVIVETQRGPVQAIVQPDQPFGFQAMRDMIIDEMLVQIAKDQGVYPSDGDVAKQLKYLQDVSNLSTGVNVVQEALKRGYTTDSFKKQVLIDLCKERIVTKGITISPQQVDDYIKMHPDDTMFSDPPRISALMILIGKDKAKDKAKIDDELKKGQPFLTVAQNNSIDPDARAVAWHYHVDVVSKMPPQVRELLEKTDINQSTDWLESSEGYVKFYVESKVKAKAKDTTNPTLREFVRRALAQQQGDPQGSKIQRLLQEKFKSIKEDAIQVEPKNYKDQWKMLMERIRSAPLAPADAPGAAAPGQGAPQTPPAGQAPPAGQPAQTPAANPGKAPAGNTAPGAGTPGKG